MSPHRRPLMTSIQVLAGMAWWNRLAARTDALVYDSRAADTLRANVCRCDVHGYPHQRGLGRCTMPRVLSSEVAGP